MTISDTSPGKIMVHSRYRLPRLTTLAVFEAVARHMSLKLAARELNVTPGAVSHQIKSLEEDLGVPLFVRMHRGVRLTAAGSECYSVLARNFSETADVLQKVRKGNVLKSATLASTTAVASLWLLPRMGSFWRDHPEIVVNHFVTDEPLDFKKAQIDLSIRYGFGSWHGESFVQLFGDIIFPVCSPAFARRAGRVETQDLPKFPLLRLEDVDPEWTSWEDWLNASGVPFTVLNGGRFNNYVIAIQAAMDGQGVTLGWRSLIQPYLDDGRLVRLTTEAVTAPGAFYVTWNANRTLSAESIVLRDWLVETAGSIETKSPNARKNSPLRRPRK